MTEQATIPGLSDPDFLRMIASGMAEQLSDPSMTFDRDERGIVNVMMDRLKRIAADLDLSKPGESPSRAVDPTQLANSNTGGGSSSQEPR